jgi:hypothetical protein
MKIISTTTFKGSFSSRLAQPRVLVVAVTTDTTRSWTPILLTSTDEYHHRMFKLQFYEKSPTGQLQNCRRVLLQSKSKLPMYKSLSSSLHSETFYKNFISKVMRVILMTRSTTMVNRLVVYTAVQVQGLVAAAKHDAIDFFRGRTIALSSTKKREANLLEG